jgi:hypothetical protein
LRALNGRLQYAAVHTRPDIAAKVGELQSNVNTATINTLLQANKILKETQETRSTNIVTVPLPLNDVAFVAFSDASFASKTRENSHLGMLICTTTAKLLANQTAPLSPIAWTSKKINRVVRSTLSAEAVALSQALDRLGWLRVFWAWLLNSSVNWREPSQILKSQNQAAAITDCKSLFDIATRTAIPACEELRTTLECLLIRERLQEGTTLRWTHSGAMLADCLTKVMDGGILREALQLGTFKLTDEEQILKQKSDAKHRILWLKTNCQSTIASPDQFSAITNK